MRMLQSAADVTLPAVLTGCLAAALLVLPPADRAGSQPKRGFEVHELYYLGLVGVDVEELALIEAMRRTRGNLGVEVMEMTTKPEWHWSLQEAYKARSTLDLVIRSAWSNARALADGQKAAAQAPQTTVLPLRFSLAYPVHARAYHLVAAADGPARPGDGIIRAISRHTARPGQIGRLEADLRSWMAQSVKAPTAIRFEIMQEIHRTEEFCIVETWPGQQAFDDAVEQVWKARGGTRPIPYKVVR